MSQLLGKILNTHMLMRYDKKILKEYLPKRPFDWFIVIFLVCSFAYFVSTLVVSAELVCDKVNDFCTVSKKSILNYTTTKELVFRPSSIKDVIVDCELYHSGRYRSNISCGIYFIGAGFREYVWSYGNRDFAISESETIKFLMLQSTDKIVKYKLY